MVDDATEIILARDVELGQKLIVLHVVADIQIIDWKFNQGLKLAPIVADSLESFQLDR